MSRLFHSIFFVGLVLLFAGCTTTRQIVVPEKHTIIQRDSVIEHRTDSVIIHKLRDTVYIEKFRFLDKYKFIKDTINTEVPVTVEVPVETTPKWAWYLLGGNLLLVLVCIGFVVFRIAKRIYGIRN